MEPLIKIGKLLVFIQLLTSCSTSTFSQNKRSSKVDFAALQDKAKTVLAKTSDLEKYKMSKVSF